MSLSAPISVTSAAVADILSAVTTRTLATVTNAGRATAYLKWDSSATPLTWDKGLPLAPGETVTINTVAAVKAICAPNDTTSLVAQDESTT